MLPALRRKGKMVPTKMRRAKDGDRSREHRSYAGSEQQGRVESFGLFQRKILIQKSPKDHRQKGDFPKFRHDVEDHVWPMGKDDLKPRKIHQKPEFALQQSMDFSAVRVNPKGEDDKEGQKEEQGHRKNETGGEKTH